MLRNLLITKDRKNLITPIELWPLILNKTLFLIENKLITLAEDEIYLLLDRLERVNRDLCKISKKEKKNSKKFPILFFFRKKSFTYNKYDQGCTKRQDLNQFANTK